MNVNYYDEMLHIVDEFFVKRSYKTALQSSPFFNILLKNIHFFEGTTQVKGLNLFLTDIYTLNLKKEDYNLLDNRNFNALIKKEQNKCYKQVKNFSKIFIKSLTDEAYYRAFPKPINNLDLFTKDQIEIDCNYIVPSVLRSAKDFEKINDEYPPYLIMGTHLFNRFLDSLPSRDFRAFDPDLKNLGFESVYHDLLLIIHEPVCPNNVGYFILPDKIYLATTQSVKSYSEQFAPFFSSFSDNKTSVRFGGQIVSSVRYAVQKILANW